MKKDTKNTAAVVATIAVILAVGVVLAPWIIAIGLVMKLIQSLT